MVAFEAFNKVKREAPKQKDSLEKLKIQYPK